jgi:hypothetical protein
VLYGVVHNDDGSFHVIDQWGDSHTPICCAKTGPTETVRAIDGKTGELITDRWYYKTPSCQNVATVCLGDGIGDLFCAEHDPRGTT